MVDMSREGYYKEFRLTDKISIIVVKNLIIKTVELTIVNNNTADVISTLVYKDNQWWVRLAGQSAEYVSFFAGIELLARNLASGSNEIHILMAQLWLKEAAQAMIEESSYGMDVVTPNGQALKDGRS